METRVTINKTDVYEEVHITTAYIGGKNGKYDKIPTLDADGPMLDALWRHAKGWAVARLGQRVAQDDSTDGCVSLLIRSDRPAATLAPLLQSALARHITGLWLEICGMDAGGMGADELIECLKGHTHGDYPMRRRVPAL
ncbi:MAG: hypothetical protein NC102_11290 [Clostridium sp.]|nr:hypothetical protein [Clostridium sp.]